MHQSSKRLKLLEMREAEDKCSSELAKGEETNDQLVTKEDSDQDFDHIDLNMVDNDLQQNNLKHDIVDSRQGKVSEKAAFITQFVGRHLGFKAVFKEAYFDFVVHELSENGDIITLTDLGESFLKEEKVVVNEQVLSSEIIEKLKVLLQSDNNVSVEIDVQDLNKVQRKDIHQYIRENFKGIETNFKIIDEKPKIVAIKVKKASRRSGYQQWPSDRLNYVHFTLYQENRGTFESLLKLSHFLKINCKNFNFAGTKDKRSISSQRVSVYRVEPQRLAKLNAIFENDSNPLQIGNFTYEKDSIPLGKLKGNHFEIVLRNVELENETDLNEIIESVSKNGFVNYFGTQRFGMRKAPSFKIGIAMLKNDWLEAVDLVLCERLIDTKSPSNHLPLSFNQCMRLWKETRNASEVYSKFYWKKSIEGLVLKGMVNSGQDKNYSSGFHQLARNTKMLYLHSYQSYLWNQLASFRIQTYGLNVLLGDLLIFTNTDFEETNIKDLGLEVATSENISKATIFDVVIPTPGFATILPENKIKDKLFELLAQDGLSLESFSLKKKPYHLSGSYRKLITKPMNVKMEMISYKNNRIPLFETDFSKLKNKKIPSSDGPLKAIKLSVSLPSSSYASVLIREITKRDLINDTLDNLSDAES